MKRFIIIMFLCFSFLSYGQKHFVIFDIDKSVYKQVDSIVFKSKRIDKYRTFLKIPRKRNIKFYLFKNEEKILITLKKNDYHKFNTISMISNSEKKHKIRFEKAHYIRTNIYEEKVPFYVSIILKLHNSILVKQNKELTINSITYDNGFKDNISFFLE